MMEDPQEQERLALQSRLDAGKTPAERNRMGQYATPAALARDIIQFGLKLTDEKKPIRFLDPAFGTGSFYSALLHEAPADRIEEAKGFELDVHYGEPACQLWQDSPLHLELSDFTRANAPTTEETRYNFLICNPPYVRHHHLVNGEKVRLQRGFKTACGIHIAGLAGLYCYFLGMSHLWMQRGGIAGWLIPSEFMDVNYGDAVKRYLLNRVTLLRIHRFDPQDMQFEDALVSSAVVWFKNVPPPSGHEVEFTFGGPLAKPEIMRRIPAAALATETKWTRFPRQEAREEMAHYCLSDLFTIKRGIATGDNKFFILSRDEIEARGLPHNFFRPILPSPRYVTGDEIQADLQGLPILDKHMFLLDCRLQEAEIEMRFPKLWAYLETGKATSSERYLCRNRKVWYFQEEREPAPILCTYIGRSDTKSGRPFRFILNHSKTTAANVYLLLYPKAPLARILSKKPTLLRRIWEVLNNLSPELLLGEGRVYGGGLHKMEPKELGNVDAQPIVDIIPELRPQERPRQAALFGP